MNSGVEELKLLQTAILMITTNSLVQHESLARVYILFIVPFFRIFLFMSLIYENGNYTNSEACDIIT